MVLYDSHMSHDKCLLYGINNKGILLSWLSYHFFFKFWRANWPCWMQSSMSPMLMLARVWPKQNKLWTFKEECLSTLQLLVLARKVISTTAKDVSSFSLPISCVSFSFFCQVHIAFSLWLHDWKGKCCTVYVWKVQFTENGN